MWFLKKLTDGTTKYLISESKSYIVGRKSCDIILEEDASISRKHCTIYIADQSECPFPVRTGTGVWVVDEQSKYGTYLKNNGDWIRINAGQNKILTNGCLIKFGLVENIWSLEYKPLIVCTSGIPTEQRKKIISSLQSIDGYLKNSWCKDCSLVIVNELTLTIKVVLALIHGIPLVTPVYLQKVVEAVKNHLPLPKNEDYRPNIKEILLDKSLVCLEVNENRKELFKGKKFLIPTKKQLETLNEIISSAGGSAELLSYNGRWEKYAEDNIVVIQLPFNNVGIPEELIKSLKEITSFLKNKYGRRVVPECEIAQAVAYASTQKFCNPKSTWFDIKLGERKEVDLGPVVVEETPIVTEETRHSPPGVVLCSATMESEPLLQVAAESQLNMHKPMGLQQNLGQETEVDFVERKRNHSPDHLNQEQQIKKPRHEKNPEIENKQSSQDISVLQKENSPKNSCESRQNKNNQVESTYITNYFQKQNKSAEESTSHFQIVRQSRSDFWNIDFLEKQMDIRKRKIETESEHSNENPDRKKAKLAGLKAFIEKKPEVENNILENMAVKGNKNNKKSEPFRRIRNVQEEIDFTGFFEKEKAESIDILNNTLFSLTLISPNYLKEDGTLIDAPEIPVNVKKFKKQKIIALEDSLEENEDFLDSQWIEAHSNCSISVAD